MARGKRQSIVGKPPTNVRPSSIPHLEPSLSSIASVSGPVIGGGELSNSARWFTENRRKILVAVAVLLGIAALATGLAFGSVPQEQGNSLSGTDLSAERADATLATTPPGARQSLPGACDLDVVFVLDSSGSLHSFRFEYVKNFVVEIVQTLYLEQAIGNLSVGVVTFHTGVTRVLSLVDGSLTEQLDMLAFVELINSMEYNGGVTCTAGGLTTARVNDLQSAFKNENTQTVVVLLTDGLPNKFPKDSDGCIIENSCDKCAGGPGGPGLDSESADKTVVAAADIRNLEFGGKPVAVVGVGVGNVDQSFLDSVTAGNYVRVSAADGLESVVPFFTRLLKCVPEEKVTKFPTITPTKSPTEFDEFNELTPSPTSSPVKSSGCVEAVDVTFVVDASSSIKTDNFELVKQYIVNLADALGPASHFSLVAFATGVTPYVLFGDSASTDLGLFTEIVTNLPYPGGVTCSAGGLEYVYHNILPLRRASPIPSVTIFIGDGLPNKYPISTEDTCTSIIGCRKCKGGPGVPGPNVESRQAAVAASILLRGTSTLDQPVRIVGVGVGNNIDEDFLASISDTYQRVAGFTDLNGIVESVVELARCPIEVTAEPTGSPVTSSANPTSSPSAWPTTSPTVWPTSSPTVWPTGSPITVASPTGSPVVSPTRSPSVSPTTSPTSTPSTTPTASPTATPTMTPTSSPITGPTQSPTVKPTASPSNSPSTSPSLSPSISPTPSPTQSPSLYPTSSPQSGPTSSPTRFPTTSPTASPTTSPTAAPTSSPTTSPTLAPTVSPSMAPTSSPTHSPTSLPTSSPTRSPTSLPTSSPSLSPTSSPTTSPTSSPTSSPTTSPTKSPSSSPTQSPTLSPTMSPTPSPTYCIDEIDLVFLVDHSGSIDDFDKVKDFIKNLVDEFEISPVDIRLAMTTFDTFVLPKVSLLGAPSVNKALFKQEVSNIPIADGGTCTAGALEYARQAMLGIRNGEVDRDLSLLRQNVPVAVLLITDGQPNMYRDDTGCESTCQCNGGSGTAINEDAVDAAVAAANALRSASSNTYPIKLLSLGVGSVDEGFLGDISDEYLKIDGLEDLASVVGAIRDMISCFPGTPSPTTTQITERPTPELM